MTRRRLYYLAFVAIWAALLGVGVKRSLDRLPDPTWASPTGGGSSLEVVSGAPVAQAFTAPLPGLYRIDVTLEQAATGSTGPITFHLKSDPAAEQDIWATTLDGDAHQSGQTLSFSFPVLPDSAEQTYYFRLEVPVRASGSGVALRYAPGSGPDGARAYVNEQPVPGNLEFKTFYSLRTRDRLRLMLNRMAAGRPYMFGSEGCYVGLGLVYVVVLGALMRKVAVGILGKQGGGP